MKNVAPRLVALLAAIAPLTLAAACSSPPSRLYMLSAVAPPPQVASADAGAAIAVTGQPTNRRAGQSAVLGVAVTIPEYLDRLDIVERTNSNELKPDYSAQWAENLAVTATRAVAEDLGTLLPAADVVMLPSRTHRDMDYQINLDLTKFESDAAGVSTLAGHWSIADSEGVERLGGQVHRSEQAKPGNYTEMAAAMSRNLAGASSDIAGALLRMEPGLANTGHAGRSLPPAAPKSGRPTE